MIGFIDGGDWPPLTSPVPAQPGKLSKGPHFDDTLSELVAGGDIAQVRGYFDKVFWEGRKERPAWDHLKIALLREDRPMLRLLGTWGATPSDDEMARFRTLAKDKYPDYVRLLRTAGLRPGNTSWEELAPAAKASSGAEEELFSALTAKADSTRQLDQVPQEWRLVLKAFQAAGADEALIAGGALRDLFNAKPVKDVDIFLRSQGSERKNRNLVKAVFAATGLKVAGQQVSSGYHSVITDFPEPRAEKSTSRSGSFTRERATESWKIIAGPDRTEYNVIFVDDNLDRQLAKTAAKSELPSLFCGGLLGSFDIGLCRIACDGREVVSTPEYRDDVKYKRVSLLLDEGAPDHLQRVVKKYADWQLNPAAQKALAPKPPAPRRYSYY